LSEVITDPITPQVDNIYYRIHPKQTLYRLSQTFDTTVEAIAAANDIQDSSEVKAGTVLRIPVKPPSGKAAYLVSSKETLYSIAHAFGLEVEELGAMNFIGPADYDDIDIGQWLVLIPDD
jgi:spore germination protein